MAFTYTSGGTSDRDKLRLLIFDVDSSNAKFQDAELDRFLEMDGNLFMAASIALRSWANKLLERAFSYSLGAEVRGALAVDRRNQVKDALALAESYEKRALDTPSEAFDRFDFNVDVFGRDASHYQGKTDPELSWEQ